MWSTCQGKPNPFKLGPWLKLIYTIWYSNFMIFYKENNETDEFLKYLLNNFLEISLKISVRHGIFD